MHLRSLRPPIHRLANNTIETTTSTPKISSCRCSFWNTSNTEPALKSSKPVHRTGRGQS